MKYLQLAIISLLFLTTKSTAQDHFTPAQSKNFSSVSPYSEITEFLTRLEKSSDLVDVEIIGKSVQKRNIYTVQFSKGNFGKDPKKIKVLIFAQQHGNEQSGKEAALMLIAELCKPENQHYFDIIDLAVIPQMNPDGAEINKRRNGNEMDLNRNHLILTEPETQALHRYFDQFQFDMSIDVHEYSPYGEEWEKYGYRKNAQVTVGALTNINISTDMRRFEKQKVLPFMLNQIADAGYTSFEYCPGGPPEAEYIRFSTFDINDGRQSLGSIGTMSFIQEGMNGNDTFVENLRNRAYSQLAGMKAFLQFAYENAIEIKKLVSLERKSILENTAGSAISIQCDHKSNGSVLKLPLVNYSTKTDTIVEVHNFKPEVYSLKNVQAPFAYLIPKNDKNLINWCKTHHFKTIKSPEKNAFSVLKYAQTGYTVTLDFEGDTVVLFPMTEMAENNFNLHEYIILPANQPKGRMLVQALEPESVLGLATYKQFAYLFDNKSSFPILKMIKIQ